MVSLDDLMLRGYYRIQAPHWLEEGSSLGAIGEQLLVLARDGVFIGNPANYNRPFAMGDLAEYGILATLLDYRADPGAFSPDVQTFTNAARLLVVDGIPEYAADPDKPLRAAAFAGWAIIVTNAPRQIERVAGTLRKRISEALHE